LFNTDIKGNLEVDEVETVNINNVDVHGLVDVDLEATSGRLDLFDFDIDGALNIHGTGGAQKAFVSKGVVDGAALVNFQNGGADQVEFLGVAALADLTINTGTAADKVLVDFFTQVGDDLTINTKGGNDVVAVKSTIIVDDLFIDVGSDDNQVTINSVIVDDIFVNLDDGDDDILNLAVEQADVVNIDADNDDVLNINAAGINTLNVIND
jgi:hypothetical protein